MDHVTLDINAFILCWKLDPVFPTYVVKVSLSLASMLKQSKGFISFEIDNRSISLITNILPNRRLDVQPKLQQLLYQAFEQYRDPRFGLYGFQGGKIFLLPLLHLSCGLPNDYE